VDVQEVSKLDAYLKRLFRNTRMRVVPRPKTDDSATNVNSGTVSPISVASSTAQRPIAVAGGSDGPDAIAITPDGKTLYVADMLGVVVPVRTATNTALEPVKVSQQPFAMAITPDGRTVYVVNYSSDDDPGFVTPIRTCAAG
jgi:hyaluronoglucosaminidase